MRGKVKKEIKKIQEQRITPAYAGKSHRFFIVAGDNGDHPRLCGEKCRFALLWLPVVGSPPPMRGKVGNGLEPDFVHGITPAYAGKSGFFQCYPRIIKDHPRLCGEKSEPENCDMNNQGSPPPMRGKAFSSPFRAFASGITPAYAGKRQRAMTAFC